MSNWSSQINQSLCVTPAEAGRSLHSPGTRKLPQEEHIHFSWKAKYLVKVPSDLARRCLGKEVLVYVIILTAALVRFWHARIFIWICTLDIRILGWTVIRNLKWKSTPQKYSALSDAFWRWRKIHPWILGMLFSWKPAWDIMRYENLVQILKTSRFPKSVGFYETTTSSVPDTWNAIQICLGKHDHLRRRAKRYVMWPF